MTRTHIYNILYTLLVIGLSGLLILSCKNKSLEGMIILTEALRDSTPGNYQSTDMWRYTPQSRIIAINPNKPAEPIMILTDSYYSARAPEISYDGECMLFAGQQKQNDPWRIWEMKLTNKAIRQITFFSENCIDPAYLPGGRIVFSKFSKNDTTGTTHTLYTCNLDGTDPKQITFHPSVDVASTVLMDGRILTISQQIFPVKEDPMLLVLRPDGTKADIFYSCLEGNTLFNKPCETRDGRLLVIETDNKNSNAGNVFSVSQNSPLHTRMNLTDGVKGSFHSVYPLPSGKFLVSYRFTDSEHFGLYEFDSKNKELGKPVFTDSKYDVLEAVWVEKHPRPKKLPSEVDMKIKTGLLMCQDINVRDGVSQNKDAAVNKAGSIEVLGLHSSLGVVQAEADGSFYLKVMADTPFRIQMLDEHGKALNSPCAWIWLRPNERRGCIGCHEDHDLVPENKIPLSVKKPPIIVPVKAKYIKEKQVTLE